MFLAVCVQRRTEREIGIREQRVDLLRRARHLARHRQELFFALRQNMRPFAADGVKVPPVEVQFRHLLIEFLHLFIGDRQQLRHLKGRVRAQLHPDLGELAGQVLIDGVSCVLVAFALGVVREAVQQHRNFFTQLLIFQQRLRARR